METNILLESGTNELELLEFFVGNEDYGINIAKRVVLINVPYCEKLGQNQRLIYRRFI